MTPRRAARAPWAPRAVVAAVAAVLLAPPALLGTTPTAAAAEDPVSVSIDALTPAVATTGSTLLVGGRVANTGRRALTDVEVRLRLSSTRLGSRTELAAVAAGRVSSRDGDVVTSVDLPDLEVGVEQAFSLRRALDDVTALASFGVHVLGVEVLATRPSGFGRVALVRTLLPWVPDEEEIVPTRFTWLWPLVARPTRLADGLFADDSLASELGPEGRLTRLVEAGATLAADGAVAWVVDPELVAAATDMADGYEVRGRGGTPVPGGGSGLAIRWLGQLRMATEGQLTVALPYGDIDVSAVVRAGRSNEVTEGLVAGQAALALALPAARVSTEVGWPARGYASRAALAALRRAEVGAVALDGRALPSTIDLAYTPTGRAQVPTRSGRVIGLLADPGLAGLLAAPGADPLLAAQRLVAEGAMIASELPSGPARSVLVMPPRRWDPDRAYLDRLVDAVAGARWAQPLGLELLAATTPPEVDRAKLAYPRAQRRAELTEPYLDAVAQMEASAAVFTTVLTEPEAYAPGLARSAQLLTSTWWRDRPEARANRLARERAYLAGERAKVAIQPANFTFSSRRGTIALTVSNELDQEVVLDVRLRPETTRLRLEPIEQQRIGPNSKEQVELDATAVAPGRVTVVASLRTAGGAAYGQPVQLRITITEYGTVALYITLGAAGVLFLAAGVRVVRRLLRARRTDDEPTEPATGTGGTGEAGDPDGPWGGDEPYAPDPRDHPTGSRA